MTTREVEDDGVSFSSDITIEADDETGPPEANIDTRRAHWSPDVVDRRDARSRPSIIGSHPQNNSANPPGEQEATHETLPVKIAKIFLELLPSLSLTCAVQFIDLMVGVSFYLIGLVVLQAAFWPSLGYVLYSQFILKSKILEPILQFKDGHWVNLFILQVHGIVMTANLLLVLLSVQYLDITVALALTFLPCLVILLMEHILAHKSFSWELLAALVLAYSGVTLVTMPALLTQHPLIERNYYNGIAASIGSSFLTIQASFILKYMKKRNVDESLLAGSAGLWGTIICVVIGAPLRVLGPLSPVNAAYISAIFLLVTLASFFGVVKIAKGKSQRIFIELNPVERNESPREREREEINNYTSINRLRTCIFAFSCFWGLFRQFYRHTVPSVFSVVGVTLIIGSFLFAMAYREWYIIVSQDSRESPENNESRPKNVNRKRPFQFIPWLFSRQPVFYIH